MGWRIAVAALAVAAYAAGLGGPFQFDDYDAIVRYAPVQSLHAFFAAHAWGLRPLLKLTYAACASLGSGPPVFHLFNLGVHLVNTELVFRLVRFAGRVAAAGTASVSRAADPGASERPALAAATLFALHPLQTEAVTYVSGRSSSLMAFFALLALFFHANGVRTGRAWLWAAAAPAAFVAAVLVKETAGILPLGLLAWDLLIERSRPRPLLARLALGGSIAAGLGVLAVLDAHYFSLLLGVVGARPLVEAARYQLGGIAYLASRAVLVAPLSIDPGLGLRPPSAAALLAGAAVMALALATAVGQRRRRPLVAFGAAWFLVHAFVPYVLFPRDDVVNERHFYLASFGVFAAAGAAWDEVARRAGRTRRGQRVAAAFPGAVALALALLTARRNLEYRSPVVLWESTVRASPQNPRAHNNLGVAYAAARRPYDARAEFERALALEPRYESPRRNLRQLEAAKAP